MKEEAPFSFFCAAGPIHRRQASAITGTGVPERVSAVKKSILNLVCGIISVAVIFGGIEAVQRVRYADRYHSAYWLGYGFVKKPKNYIVMMENMLLRKGEVKNIEASVIYYKNYYKYNPRAPANKDRINTLGFRGNEIGPKERFRIVALGGSTTYGVGVDDDSTYPALLEKKTGAEVINAGVSEAYLDNIQALFENEIIELRPDLIIINSVANNMLNSSNMYKYSIPQKINHFLLSKSLFYMTLREKIRVMAKKSIVDIYRSSFNEALGAFMNDETFYNSMKEKYRDIIRKARENNIEVMIIKEPAWLKDRAEEPTGMLLDTRLKPVWDRFYALLDAVGKEERVTVIDTSGIPATQDYFTDGLHLTARGNEYLAGLIAAHVKPR